MYNKKEEEKKLIAFTPQAGLDDIFTVEIGQTDNPSSTDPMKEIEEEARLASERLAVAEVIAESKEYPGTEPFWVVQFKRKRGGEVTLVVWSDGHATDITDWKVQRRLDERAETLFPTEWDPLDRLLSLVEQELARQQNRHNHRDMLLSLLNYQREQQAEYNSLLTDDRCVSSTERGQIICQLAEIEGRIINCEHELTLTPPKWDRRCHLTAGSILPPRRRHPRLRQSP